VYILLIFLSTKYCIDNDHATFSQKPLCFLDIQWIVVIASLDTSMDIHSTSVNMDMDMNVNFYIHGNPGYFWLIFGTFANTQSK